MQQQQQQTNMNNLINHQNILNENLQMNFQNKNIPINNLNSAFNPMSKVNPMMHLMNSPNMANPQHNMNIAGFSGRAGK